MDDKDAQELARTMAEGFHELGGQVKELQAKLTTVLLEREYEKGLELKKKVEKNVDDIAALNIWKTGAETTMGNTRKMGWMIIGALISLVAAYIGSHFIK